MQSFGSPEREPQLDAFSEAKVVRPRTVAISISNIQLGIPPIYAQEPAQDAYNADKEQYFNSRYPTPDNVIDASNRFGNVQPTFDANPDEYRQSA